MVIVMEINKNSDDYCFYQARINIKKYRKKLGITAQELADRTEFSHQFIRSLEALKVVKRPRLDTLARIAKALNIELRQLFDDVNQETLDKLINKR